MTGAGLLLRARWPLYRQGRFLCAGPRFLDARHRRYYRQAYLLTGISAVLFLILMRWPAVM